MQGTSTLQELQSNQQQIQNSQLQIQQQQQQQQHHQQQTSQFNNNPSTHDDFLDQMLSHIPSWPQLPTNPKSPYNPTNIHNLFKDPSNDPQHNPDNNPPYPYDDSSLLASRLRQQQISCSSPPGIPTTQIISGAVGSRSQPSLSGLLPFPLTLGGSTDPSDSRMQEVPNPFKPPNLNEEGPIQGLYNGLAGSLPRPAQASQQQQFHHPQTGSISSSHPGSGAGGGGGGTPARPKVRARRGQATDPHSIAERLRRERIAERMKALQELVPNANKTDKASMLDEIIDYVKFLQLQVKVLSMSRLGGAAAVAPLVADISSEGGGDCIQASGIGRSSNGTQTASNDSITATEHQVAKMMEEDMGSAMQYLQGKGLCKMADAAETLNGDTIHDLQPLLSSEGRDFLVRNNGDQVKIADLVGKIVGIYFSASWCGPCQRFTPTFVEAYKDLYAKGDFEAVFVSADEDEESFKEYFAKMPWLAIPFSDSTTHRRLNELFKVNGIPNLVILGGNGKVLSNGGVMLIKEYGVEAYPFSPERLNEINEEEEAARRNQSLSTLLVTQSRDFLISNDGNKVLVSEIQGKMVALYFCFSSSEHCQEFTSELVEMYKKLKDKEEKFEVVLISLDDDEQSYKEILKSIPFLAVPFQDKICEKLIRYFELRSIPTLVIIGSDGKTVNSNVAELVEEHGIQAYPFTPEKLEELAEIERKRLESLTLESLLVSGERDFVIGKDGIKVPVSELFGKHILLYFSAHWCPPCRAFLPKLTEVYHEIKAKDPAFELIFISSDGDQKSFDDYFSSMPWLALPFGDERKKFLSRTFKIKGIPSLVAIGPTGKTITTEAIDLVAVHGSDAYPFTEEHLKAMEAKTEEMAKGWPEKVKHDLHTQHELELKRRRVYNCDGCGVVGHAWSYYCEECDFDLHPKCALEEEKKGDDEKDENKEGDGHEGAAKEGWVCDGDVCQKA